MTLPGSPRYLDRVRGEIRICPRCLRALGAETPLCSADGEAPLVLPPALPPDPPALGLLPEDVLAPDSALGRGYRVVRLVGAGGMGAVYEVEHQRLGRRFAAKLLRREAARDPGALSRFEREAVAASRIQHRNIVEMVNLDDTEDGRVFIVEELLVGVDLSRLCAQPVPVPLALSIGITVARALHAAHASGIVHRDLKPANIFLARSGDSYVVKVLDFGISKIIGDDSGRATTTGAFAGTPLYMAPEQAREGAAVDARSDLYSLGVILYELLAGRPPFQSRNPLDLALKHLSEAPPPLLPGNPAVPPAVEAEVLRALCKAPEDRHPSMEAFADALARAAGTALGPLPERVHTLGTPLGTARLAARPPRRRALAWGAGILALGIVSVGTGWWLGRSREPVAGGPAPVDGAGAPAEVAAPRLAPAPVAEPAAAPPLAEGSAAPRERSAPAAEVALTIRSRPAGAQVSLDGREVGSTPLAVRLAASPQAVMVQLTKPGFRELRRRVVPDRSQELSVPLEPMAPPALPESR